jgi:hypothetical protein
VYLTLGVFDFGLQRSLNRKGLPYLFRPAKPIKIVLIFIVLPGGFYAALRNLISHIMARLYGQERG